MPCIKIEKNWEQSYLAKKFLCKIDKYTNQGCIYLLENDYVTSRKMDEPSAQHFCQAGHSAHDLVALGLEHVRSRDPFILRAREHLLIKKFDSYRNGLNQEPWTWLATLASIFLLVSHSIYVLLDEYDCSIWFIKHACDHGNLNFPKILKLCKVLSWIWWESFVGHFTK